MKMSIKKLRLAVLLGLGLGATSGAFAASSVDLSVVGTITPTACDIQLSKASVALGKISSSDLSATAVTELKSDKVDLTVTCNAAAMFTLATQDGAPGTATDSGVTSFGVGKTSDDENIGYFSMRFDGSSLDADGETVIGLASQDKNTWTPANTTPANGTGAVEGPALSHGPNFLAFGDAGTTAPKNIEKLTGTLQVRTFVAPTDGLTLTNDVDLAGNATIEVVYL